MKLFGSYTSPFVRHCRIAMLEGGLQCELVEADYSASAQLSPSQKVPFLHADDLVLTDSTSILKYLRERAGETFLSDVQTCDLYCLTNTVVDTSLNLFQLEKEGMSMAGSPYLQRQMNRITTGLEALEAAAASGLTWDDGSIRLACALGWIEYRQRADLTPYPALRAWHAKALEHDAFAKTEPPPA